MGLEDGFRVWNIASYGQNEIFNRLTSLLIGYWLTMNLLQMLFVRHTVNEATRQ